MNTPNVDAGRLERRVRRRTRKEWLLLFRSWFLNIRRYTKNNLPNEGKAFNIACNLSIIYWILYVIYIIII